MIVASIQEQIKLLQRRQAKADFLKSVIEKFNGMSDSIEHEGLRGEVGAVLIPFLEAQIRSAELGDVKDPEKEKPSPAKTTPLSSDEVSLVRAVLSRLSAQGGSEEPIARDVMPPVAAPAPRIDKNAALAKAARADKLRFAMENQHLANRRVQVNTKDGAINGSVQGLDAPNVIVKLDTGYTVPFELEAITLL